jgi:hypothetical protein
MLAAGALVAQARSPTLIESLSRPILGATAIAPDKPKSALALMQANLDWFSHYPWNEPIPKDSPLYGQSEMGRKR